MDSLMLLWDFAPTLKTKLLYLAIFAQMCLAIYAYTVMSKARLAAGRAKRITADDYKATRDEPEDLRVYTRAVANQFEMPVLFYAVILAMLTASVHSWITVALAWAYVIIRVIHMREMIGSNQVKLRRNIFIYSARILLLMMAELLLAILFLVQA
ncbi:MAG: MAPEG family protein [Rhizobiaceae bacterium]